nr:immunoglobulin light chain junction region [Macaca mulatta]MOW07187.1 immunoglobulin light chain junction region [Macaca mulatta]
DYYCWLHYSGYWVF